MDEGEAAIMKRNNECRPFVRALDFGSSRDGCFYFAHGKDMKKKSASIAWMASKLTLIRKLEIFLEMISSIKHLGGPQKRMLG